MVILKPVRNSKKVDSITENDIGGGTLVSECICMHALAYQTYMHTQTLVHTYIHKTTPKKKSQYPPAPSIPGH